MDPASVRGTDWTAQEVELVVADYFAMLMHELQGRPFVKAVHNRELQRLTGRSRVSIEQKHRNISAVLLRLGEPFINGYKPLAHYQTALLQAVEGLLDRGAAPSGYMPVTKNQAAERKPLFVEPPPNAAPEQDSTSPEMVRLLQKFDPAERDHRNRELGKRGEEHVLHHERWRLRQIGREDLSRKVRWVSQEDGDGAGFDILSFSKDGDERFLEVTTTTGNRLTPFFISRNEKRFSDEHADRTRIFRLYDFSREPRAFKIRPPIDRQVNLDVEVYKASFG